jgi:hypothetical protein
MSLLHRMPSLSTKVIISITALSVLTFLLPAITAEDKEVSEVVDAVADAVAGAVDSVIVEVVVGLEEVVEPVVVVVATVSVVAVAVECLHSKERKLHSKPCLSGTFLFHMRGTVGLFFYFPCSVSSFSVFS